MSLWQDFLTNDDLLIHKWTHYFPVYERHFARFRNLDVTLLEIGVAQGGSLRMWKRFLGPYAKIVGIDINPACKAAEEEQVAVRIGSQADPSFLENLLAEFGVPDVVLDDGSHQTTDVNATFDYLFPRLGKNSIYAVEDLHTAYRPEYGGGLGKPDTFIERSKRLIDQLNVDHTRGQLQRDMSLAGLSSIHWYESMVVIEKIGMGRRHAPRIGRPLEIRS
jgi:hypothetical protein